LEFGNVGFWRGRKKDADLKRPAEQGREPTKNSTHMMLGPGMEPLTTLVGGECSHHCAILVFLENFQ